MRQRYGYWLAGQEADEGAWLEVRDKFTGDPLTEVATASPATIERAIHYLSASRHLERIADHATNIAEDVLFLVEGTVVRHTHEEYR